MRKLVLLTLAGISLHFLMPNGIPIPLVRNAICTAVKSGDNAVHVKFVRE